MAEGGLASAVTIAGHVAVYPVPLGRTATITVHLSHIINDAVVSVYAGLSGTAINTDLLFPATTMTAGTNNNITIPAVLSELEILSVTSTVADVAVRVDGFEDVVIS